MMESDSLDKDFVNVYINHLVKSYSHIKKQKQSQDNLKQHMDSLKKNLKPGKKKMPKDFNFTDEWKELEQRIDIALEHQTKVIKHMPDDNSFQVNLIKSVEALDNKLTKFLQFHQDRKEKINKIESKLKDKAFDSVLKEKDMIKAKTQIKAHIDDLEKSLKFLENDITIDREKHSALKNKIKELKKRL